MNRQEIRPWALLALLLTAMPGSGAESVGYINVSLPRGFSLISNPLFNFNPSISNIFTRRVPDGFTVYVLKTNGYRTATYDADLQQFKPDDAAQEQIPPGRGFFVHNPGGAAITITFTGTIREGTLTNSMPAGFSIVSPSVPRTGTLQQLGFPAEFGDYVYYFNSATQRFEAAMYDDLEGDWFPRFRTLQPSEAFFVLKRRPAVWTQVSSIN